MIGPVLVRQDTLEARSNVDKRLEFIGGGRVGGRQWLGGSERQWGQGVAFPSCRKPPCGPELPAASRPGP